MAFSEKGYCAVDVCYRLNLKDPGLQEGMILSDEPGYYEDGNFGIRYYLARPVELISNGCLS